MILLLLFSSEILAQEKTLDQVYNRLDSFNSAPTEAAVAQFKNELSEWQPSSPDFQLAKVISLCNLGFTQRQFGQLLDAIKSYETAKKIFVSEQLSRYDIINACYIPLGNLYTQTNAWSEAENQIKAYILQAESENRLPVVVTGLYNLAVVFESAGNPQQAIATLQRGLQIAPVDSRLLLRLATNQITIDELSSAEQTTKLLLENYREKAEVHQLHAKLLSKKGNHREALKARQSALILLQKINNTSPRILAKAHLEVAKGEMVLGNKQAVNAGIRAVYGILIENVMEGQIIPSKGQLYAENTLIDALDLQAAAFTSEGKPEKAYQCYQRAIFVSDLLDRKSTLQSTKLVAQSANKRRGEKAIDLLYNLFDKTKDTVWLSESLKIDQGVKAPVLQEAQRLQQQLLRYPESELTRKVQNSQWVLATLQNRLDKVENGQITNPDTVAAIQNRFNIARLMQLELLDDFSSQFPDLENDIEISVANIQQKTATKDATLVSYFIGNQSIYQWIIFDGNIVFKQLAKTAEERDSFLATIKEYNRFFQKAANIANDPSHFARVSYRLYQQLELPKAKKMVVIPDGILAFVPFSSLLVNPAQDGSFGSLPYLLFDTDVSYQVSLDGFLTSEALPTANPNVLGVFPVFKGTARELTYSNLEAEALSEKMNVALLMEEKATAEAFLRQSKNADILHISTHALGGTFTTAARIEFYDRDLTDTELYGYPFQKDLVVLSACETGVGMVLKGEGPQSIARAFQYAGTENVLFSLWKVNDLTTAQLMEQFYSEVNKKVGYQRALHNAKTTFLADESIDDLRKSPYYWAGFVYYGSTTAHDNSSLWYLWLLLPLGLLLVGVYLRKNRK